MTNNQKNLHRYVGSIEQQAYVRRISYGEGRANGLGAYLVKNGRLEFTVLLDKCLDIAELSYKGMNMSFLAKPGLMGRNSFDTRGREAQRSIMGGFLFTCGTENIGAPCSDKGTEYPMHGRMRTTPANYTGSEAVFEDGSYVLKVYGTMREAELFGENMVLRRRISTVFGSRSFSIHDTITNEAFRDEPFMLLYHFNIGYPFLTESTRVILPSLHTEPRDEAARAGISRWREMDPPLDNAPEQVFIHELAEKESGESFACAYNDKEGAGLLIEFNKMQLPQFYQWKSAASGDYVIGLEPACGSIFGRTDASFHKRMLKPFESVDINFKVTLLDGIDDLNAVFEKYKMIMDKEIKYYETF